MAKSNATAPELEIVVLIGPVRHDGVDYVEGDELKLTADQAEALRTVCAAQPAAVPQAQD